jgi:(E)-2-((N-methylformamido)methylene)succinate hydrolase
MKPTDPAVVLVHGVGLDHTLWRDVVAGLPNRRTVTYDMIGHGSAQARPGPYVLGMFVDQLAAVVRSLACPVDVVGFSMGALVAHGFAVSDRAEQLRSLVLLNGVYDRSTEEREAISERVAEVRRDGPLGTIEAALERWFTPRFAAAHPDVIDGVRRRLMANDPRSYADAYEVFATADQLLAGTPHRVSAPTLVMTGADDQRSTPAMARRLAAALGDGRCNILPGLRHLTPLEAPGLVASAIDDFCGTQR